MCGVGTKDGKIEKQVMDINNDRNSICTTHDHQS